MKFKFIFALLQQEIMFAKVESKKDINQIKIKVDKLIFLHHQLTEKYEKLKNANNELQLANENHHKTIKDLQEANKMLKLAESLSGSNQNTQALKVKINEYIREIDRCMALLNK